MKRKSPFILALILILMLSVGGVAGASTWKIMKVTVSGANVRSGPGNYEIIDMVKRGSTVICTERASRAYYKVITPAGKTGYIFRDHVETISSFDSSSIYTATTRVNLRKEPSAHSRRVGKISDGALVRVLDKHDGWCYVVTMDGKKGYVKAEYLER